MERRLAAILAADVAGYSRLMEADEEATVRTLDALRQVIDELVADHRGRIFGSAGDSVVAEFPSPVEAVRCAVGIQREVETRNSDLPEDRRMRFRIGLNLGDVIVKGDNLLGDGVNIAARLETLADAGGIFLSRPVLDQIKKRLHLGYEFLGEHEVKNIAEPVAVYRVLFDGQTPGVARKPIRRGLTPIQLIVAALVVVLIAAGGVSAIWQPWAPDVEPASIEPMAFPLPEKPSIAVLPFVNLSGDERQEYFADGMTDDIITDLSKISGLFVVARNSAFVYKGKAVKIADIGRELGVRYVLEGSIRKEDNRVRITAQLVDAVRDGHLWAERYDRELKEIFALQDEVTRKIVEALAVTLTEDEQKRVVRKYTNNMDAYDYYLRGWEYFSDPTREANVLARQMQQRAIDLDPEFAAAHALLGFTYSQEWTIGWGQDPRTLDRAFELAQRAIALDPLLPLGYAVLGEVYLWKKEHEKAIAAQEKAIALSPNDADQIAGLGGILTWAGRPDETIDLIKKAMRLNPMYPIEYLWNLGHANFLLGRHEEAIEALKRIRDRNPDYVPAHAYLAASYSELGWEEEAQAEAAEVKRLSSRPIEAWEQSLPYKDQAVLARVLSSWRKAGLQ
jgi:adenylate cyclase